MKNSLFSPLLVLFLIFSWQGRGFSSDMMFPLENYENFLGAGVGLVPDYDGSDDYMVGGAPFARFQFKGKKQYIMLFANELQVNISNHPWFRIGPSLLYRFGRDDSVNDSVVKKMKEIDGTFEAGGFIGVEFIDDENPRKRFVADVDILADIANEHKGYTIMGSARVWYPIATPFDIGLGIEMEYASENFMSTYFGVDKGDSKRTGLPVFDAESGLKDIKINGVLILHLNYNWHIATGLQYRRLLSDAKDSPVVDLRGSANQWILGLGLLYNW